MSNDTINDLLNYINNEYNNNFLDTKHINIIETVVRDLFPRLNNSDINILQKLTIFIVDLISFKYNFQKEDKYYDQWKQNNNQDIKGVTLLLLPYINDMNNSELLNQLLDLNHLLFNGDDKQIIKSNELLYEERNIVLKNKFKFGNMAIGLLDENNNIMLDLYKNNDKTIYYIIVQHVKSIVQTLEMINSKLYINWVNIIPLNLNNYHSNYLYMNTKNQILYNQQNNKEYIQNHIINCLLENIIRYNGLWFGDIYNILRVKFYEDIKELKWLIFCYELNNDNIYILQGLHKMINLENIINNTYYYYLTLEEQNMFIFRVGNLIKNIKNKISTTFSLKVDIEIIKYTVINFGRNINNEENKYKKKFLSSDNPEEESDENIINEFEYIKENYINNLWDFLKESLEKFNNTTYGKYLLNYNDKTNKIEINNNYYYERLSKNNMETNDYTNNVKNKINLKNIYNIAKSLSHNNINDWIEHTKNYNLLNFKDKVEFFIRLFDNNNNSWLKIKNNLQKQYLNNYNRNYDTDIKNMLKTFRYIYIDLIFEDLVTSGLLNTFQVNLEITNKLLLPTNTSAMKKKRKELLKKLFNKNEKEWNEAYYYNTNMKYKHLKKIRIEKDNKLGEFDKYDELTYFELIADKHEWSTYYAMDHISQISFFQHYIFHNILYVTGATGQGKSTQVPKLLLYAMKMLDYKNNGKIICTQPRTTPTVGNASRISEELGLPLDQIDNNHQTKVKTNNYYVQYKHMKGNHNKKRNSYNILEIVTDGTLYQIIKKNPKMKNDNNNNVYDIIIIDEAHEHNSNMDLIITIARQTCKHNKDIKLIIVSATMDDDEPIYRRYFKDINIISNNKDITKFWQVNTKFIDRRYHISPPGQTTQYNINEYYEDTEPSENNKTNSLLIQERGYKKILEICNKTSGGEILFFANGQNEILKAVEYLNKILPIGNIALPYFSDMNIIYKNIIESIDKKIYSIKNERENIHLEWGSQYIEDKNVSDGLYKRAIIIATNVAEASITIPNLQFVIDNGYNKVNKYNMNNNKTVLVEEKISEASRLQRKGRVGRISDGTVYYLYPKRAREKILPSYKITQENISDKLIELLHNNENNKLPEKFIELEFYEKKGEIGQYIENLVDLYGKFYLIHPFEDKIKRNILNNIFKFNNNNTNKINIDHYKYIFTNLLNRNLLVDNSDSLYHYKYEHSDNRKFIKSEFCDKILNAGSKFSDFEIPKLNTTLLLVAAYNMNCYTEVYELTILIEILGNTIEKISSIPFNKYKIINSNVSSDIIFLYNIIKKFKEQFNLKIFNIDENKLKIIKNDENNNYNEFINLRRKYSTPPSNYDEKIWNQYNDLYNNNKKIDKIYLGNEIKNDINYNKNNIIKWCKIQNIDSNIILKFLKVLSDKYNDIDLINPKEIFKELVNKNYISQLIGNNIEEKILRSFIYGYPDQIAIKTNNLNVTLTTYMNYNLLSVKESICKDKRIESTSSLASFSNIIFYLTYEPSIVGNEINEGMIQVSYINHIDPRWIIPANPLLFNPKYYSELSKYILNNNNVYYINNSEYYNYLVRVISNNWNENVTIWNMKNMPILQKYLQKVNNIISRYK